MDQVTEIKSIVVSNLFSCFELDSYRLEAFDNALTQAGVKSSRSLLDWLERKLPDELLNLVGIYVERWLEKQNL